MFVVLQTPLKLIYQDLTECIVINHYYINYIE